MSDKVENNSADLLSFSQGIHEIQWLNRDVWLINQSWGQLIVAKLGAQILHYLPKNQQSVFWVNTPAASSDTEAVRGGVPLCWPWFGVHENDSTKANHGVARTAMWELDSVKLESELESQLSSKQDNSILTFKPVANIYEPFDIAFVIVIGENYLSMKICTENRSDKAQSLTQAIHSYFRVSNSEEIVVKGLKNCEHLDKLEDNKLKKQHLELNNIDAIDSVFKHSADVVIIDHGLSRQIHITKAGSGSTVVWNPGSAAHKYAITTGQTHFICIEAANTQHEALFLAPVQKVELLQSVQLHSIDALL